jgi:hypothetical protein
MPGSTDLTVLTAADVDAVLASIDLHQAIASQATVFDAFSASTASRQDGIPHIQNPHRVTIESEQATSLFMPARVSELGTTCKIVSVPKAAGPGGLPAVTMVLDERGVVRGLVNARRLTAMRNACGEHASADSTDSRVRPVSSALSARPAYTALRIFRLGGANLRSCFGIPPPAQFHPLLYHCRAPENGEGGGSI